MLIRRAVTLEQAFSKRRSTTGVWRIARLLRMTILPGIANENTRGRDGGTFAHDMVAGGWSAKGTVGPGGARGTVVQSGVLAVDVYITRCSVAICMRYRV
jgi:hypothetical protein